MIDASAFNFDTMKQELGTDPFAKASNKYEEDARFYKLPKDENGNGVAIIRFLPDSEKGMIQTMRRINTTIFKNGKKRFVNEFSPASAGLPCPFQEEWQRLWNEGKKDPVKDASGNIVEYGSKSFNSSTRYITNIKVIKDPKNPGNEGKIFMLEMSGGLKDKIQAALSPSEEEMALGATRKELFNPLAGHNFKLVSKKGANGIINYDSSEVYPEVSSIYDSVEEAIEDIKANTYKLSDLKKPESFLSYEELTKKLQYVKGENTQTPATVAQVAAVATVSEVAQAAPAVQLVTEVQPAVQPVPAKQADSLDDLLAGL